jgi:hypothetical protein
VDVSRNTTFATPVAGFAELLVIGAGYAAEFRFQAAYRAVPLACLTALAIAVVSICIALANPLAKPTSSLNMNQGGWAGCLLLYVIVTECGELLSFGGSVQGLLVGVAWLLPPIVGGVVLPRRGLWLTALGYWLVLFGGAAALAYNFSHWNSGFMGFFHGWVF